MQADGSITRWIEQLQDGDAAAIEALWRAYFPRLVALARGRLRDAPPQVSDEEDVALSALHSFFNRASTGQFPRLTDRQSLWPLLVVITARKCAELFRHENRLKRRTPGHDPIDLEQMLGREPTPEFAAQAADQLEHLLGLLDALGDPDLRKIALGKMEGDSAEDIAGRLDCSRRSVERKLELIVRVWEREEDAS